MADDDDNLRIEHRTSPKGDFIGGDTNAMLERLQLFSTPTPVNSKR